MVTNFSASYLVYVVDLGFFESTAKKYKLDALRIKNENFGSCTPTFHLLSSLAFELFPKVLLGYEICLKYKENSILSEEEIRNKISEEMRNCRHHLGRLYGRFPELLKHLNIEKISEFKNGYAWEYRIKLKNNDDEILLKDIEAIRYGSFAKNMDIMTLCIHDELIIDLLNKIEKYVEIKRKETYELLKL